MIIKSDYPRPELLCQAQIVKPLHGVNPRTILGDVWWDDVRQRAYKATNYHCAACGVKKSEAKEHQWLEAHECYSIDYKNYTYIFEEVVALCHYCHNFIHAGRLEMLFSAGKINADLYYSIWEHGDSILYKAKLDKHNILKEECKDFQLELDVENPKIWKKWKMIIEGKSYKSKF
jgi:hypothetical protein